MASKRRQARELAAALLKLEHLKAETQRLEQMYRESLIGHIIDLEIVGGTKGEKERRGESLKMTDPRKYPLAALEYTEKIIVALLSRSNRPPEESAGQIQPQRGYIQ
jgi:hypothetical protein